MENHSFKREIFEPLFKMFSLLLIFIGVILLVIGGIGQRNSEGLAMVGPILIEITGVFILIAVIAFWIFWKISWNKREELEEIKALQPVVEALQKDVSKRALDTVDNNPEASLNINHYTLENEKLVIDVSVTLTTDSGVMLHTLKLVYIQTEEGYEFSEIKTLN